MKVQGNQSSRMSEVVAQVLTHFPIGGPSGSALYFSEKTRAAILIHGPPQGPQSLFKDGWHDIQIHILDQQNTLNVRKQWPSGTRRTRAKK